MEVAARTAIAILLALVVASGFLCDGACGAVTVFDVVKDFGAAGDGVTDDTRAVKAAWGAACRHGGGQVVVLAAAGHSFLVHATVFAGPCQGSVTLQVDGTIVAPGDPETWPANSKRKWLVFYRAHGVSLRGGGLIDGKGHKWWDLPCKPHTGTHGANANGSCDSPVVRDSPQFHLRFDGCRGVVVRGLAITSPAASPNTDGIHVEDTRDVVIADTAVSSGDDCVSIGAGALDVLVENVTCGPGGHGISIGSLGKPGSPAPACVANVTVRDSVVRRSENGVRIKTWQGGAGAVTSVRFERVRVDAVRRPIVIDQYYCRRRDGCRNGTTSVLVAGVSYAGVRGTYVDDGAGGPPVRFACSDAAPCTGITLADVELLPASGGAAGGGGGAFCWNAYGTAAAATVPPVPCLMGGAPSNIQDNSSKSNLKCMTW
ncbi:hypothetical protein ACP4OV_021062 [Aristida adscensionis]